MAKVDTAAAAAAGPARAASPSEQPAKPVPAPPTAQPTAPTSQPSQAPSAQPAPPLTPEMQARIGEVRTHIQLSVGQTVLAIMNLARYRTQSVADLSHLIIEPLLRDRIAIAHRTAKPTDAAAQAGAPAPHFDIAGIAIWATVSDAVDAKITEQVKAGVFPVRLNPDDWVSGDHVWLLDVIAGDTRQSTSVLANFRQLAGDRLIKVHPVVGRLIEPEVLAKLRVGATP